MSDNNILDNPVLTPSYTPNPEAQIPPQQYQKQLDSIESLPVDDTIAATPGELQILQRYFQNKAEGRKLYFELREVLFATIIFFLLANPLFDRFLDYIPNMGSPLIRMGAKIVIFFVLYYVTVLIINSK